MAKFHSPNDPDTPDQDVSAGPGVDPTAIAIAVAAAMAPLIQQMQQGQAEMIAALLKGQTVSTAEAVKAARTKRPESYLGDFPFPGMSHFSPTGEKLPPLRCESFLGYWDEDENGQLTIYAGYPYVADEYGGCTLEERTLLNNLEAGVYRAKRRDGMEGIIRVQIKHDIDGQPTRLVVAPPKTWLTMQMKNMVGGVDFLRQLQPDVAQRVRDKDAA
jgi:hypothetical protein